MNTLFKSIYDSVVRGRTNRPALIDETRTAIKEATMELHGMAKFFKDLSTSNVFVSNGEATKFRFTLSLPMRSLWRLTALHSDNAETPLKLYTISMPSRWDSNWYRVFGKQIEAQLSRPAGAFRVEYFAYPDLSDTGYNSWIAESYPYAVADLAAAKVFSLVEPTTAQLFFARVGSPALTSSHMAKIVTENPHAVD